MAEKLADKYKDLLSKAGKLYATDDGQVFYKKEDAEKYANTRGYKVQELIGKKKAEKKEDKPPKS